MQCLPALIYFPCWATQIWKSHASLHDISSLKASTFLFAIQLSKKSKLKADLRISCRYYQLISYLALLSSLREHTHQVTSFSSSFHWYFGWQPCTSLIDRMLLLRLSKRGQDLGRSGHQHNTLEEDLAFHNMQFPDSPLEPGQSFFESLGTFYVMVCKKIFYIWN